MATPDPIMALRSITCPPPARGVGKAHALAAAAAARHDDDGGDIVQVGADRELFSNAPPENDRKASRTSPRTMEVTTMMMTRLSVLSTDDVTGPTCPRTARSRQKLYTVTSAPAL